VAVFVFLHLNSTELTRALEYMILFFVFLHTNTHTHTHTHIHTRMQVSAHGNSMADEEATAAAAAHDATEGDEEGEGEHPRVTGASPAFEEGGMHGAGYEQESQELGAQGGVAGDEEAGGDAEQDL
jgi:hypothetical protein